MKTTIKTAPSGASVTVRPNTFVNGTVVLSIVDGLRSEVVNLTQDQCGALIFGIERAIETIELRNAARLAA